MRAEQATRSTENKRTVPTQVGRCPKSIRSAGQTRFQLRNEHHVTTAHLDQHQGVTPCRAPITIAPDIFAEEPRGTFVFAWRAERTSTASIADAGSRLASSTKALAPAPSPCRRTSTSYRRNGVRVDGMAFWRPRLADPARRCPHTPLPAEPACSSRCVKWGGPRRAGAFFVRTAGVPDRYFSSIQRRPSRGRWRRLIAEAARLPGCVLNRSGAGASSPP